MCSSTTLRAMLTATRIRNDFAQILVPEGVFSNVSDGLTIYARQRGDGGVLQGLIVYDGREAGRPRPARRSRRGTARNASTSC